MGVEHLHILQHALGVDQYGQGRQYRNHFCAGGKDEQLCRELVEMGFMKHHPTTDVFPYYNCSVTEEGKLAMTESSPKPPKLTRSQLRYRSYMNWADVYEGTFREFLQYEKDKNKREALARSAMYKG